MRKNLNFAKMFYTHFRWLVPFQRKIMYVGVYHKNYHLFLFREKKKTKRRKHDIT